MEEEREDRYVECSGRLVLECKKCGEHLLLLGLDEDWRSAGVGFECECGQRLTLADRGDEEELAIRRLLERVQTNGTT